jgi:hypothetical protein
MLVTHYLGVEIAVVLCRDSPGIGLASDVDALVVGEVDCLTKELVLSGKRYRAGKAASMVVGVNGPPTKLDSYWCGCGSITTESFSTTKNRLCAVREHASSSSLGGDYRDRIFTGLSLTRMESSSITPFGKVGPPPLISVPPHSAQNSFWCKKTTLPPVHLCTTLELHVNHPGFASSPTQTSAPEPGSVLLSNKDCKAPADQR